MDLIVQYRQKKNLSQTELARKLGVSNPTLCLIESGKRRPGIPLSKKIEKVTGIPRAKLRPDVWGRA